MLWVLISITILGFTLLALGIRGRVVGEEPRCCGCLFDLSGLDLPASGSTEPQEPGNLLCPECGTGLSSPRAIRHGLRRRSWRRAVLGAGLLLPMVGVIVLASQGTAWTKWNTTKPLWVLELDARFGSSITESEAVNELYVRSNTGKLSQGTHNRLTAMAAQRLGQGTDGSLEWYDFAIEGRVAGEISEKSWAGINERMIKVGEGLFENMEYQTVEWFYNSRRQSDIGIDRFTYPNFAQFTKPVQLLYTLKSVEVEGQPMVLANLSARERIKGRLAQGITRIETIGLNYYRSLEQIQNGPDRKVIVKRRSSWFGHEMSDGITIDDLSIGKHTTTATWQAYIVVETFRSGPNNTLAVPAFGPFEVTKEFEYSVVK